jgi:lipopolysaccharide biosynthesis glycosyltransferase
MNLDNLRKEDFVSKSLVLIKEKMNCEWYDQDIINYVCKDKIKFLNYQWNTLYLAYVNHLFLYVKFKTKIYPNFSLFNFKKSVAILHFAGECKPWVFTKNYFAKEWKKIWDIIFKG